MSTQYQTPLYAANTPANTGHGINRISNHLHGVSGSISTWATNDTILVGWLPRNAVVVSTTLKADGQLDSNGSPTLTFDLGVVGTPQLFKAAVSTVGRAAGASIDTTIAASGSLWSNTTGARVAVLVTAHNGAATPVAGVVEVDVEFYVEDTPGSNP
jgi:hypothetical protein